MSSLADGGDSGPLRSIRIADDSLGLLGHVVIDRTVHGTASGGVRWVPGITEGELAALARTMTLKWALLSIPMGGAKAGLSVDVQTMTTRRDQVMEAFGRATAGLIKDRVFLPGLDLGTTLDDLRTIMAAAGQPLSVDQIDGSAATALTVFECIRQVVQSSGVDLVGLRVGLEGFGKVGASLAQLLLQAGARLTALTTVEGGVAAENGLEIGRLLELKERCGDGLVKHVVGATRFQPADLPGQPVDVLIPGARPWLIHVGNVESVRARWIVPIANAPVTPDAEVRLSARGVMVVPDFVANCGGILASDLHSHGFTLAEGRVVIEGTYARLVRSLIQAAGRSGRSVGDEARILAWRRHQALALPPSPSSRGRSARPWVVLQRQGARGLWWRFAWRLYRAAPKLSGRVRAAALARMQDMRLGATVRALTADETISQKGFPSDQQSRAAVARSGSAR